MCATARQLKQIPRGHRAQQVVEARLRAQTGGAIHAFRATLAFEDVGRLWESESAESSHARGARRVAGPPRQELDDGRAQTSGAGGDKVTNRSRAKSLPGARRPKEGGHRKRRACGGSSSWHLVDDEFLAGNAVAWVAWGRSRGCRLWSAGSHHANAITTARARSIRVSWMRAHRSGLSYTER